MSELTIVRTNQELPADLQPARDLLFKSLSGWDEATDKSWRRIWKRIVEMEPGELVSLEMKLIRNPKFHRKFFVLLNIGFDAWEPGRKRKTYKGRPVLKNFEQFREDVICLAGFSEQTFDLRGRMKVKAKSIAFGSMEQDEFEELYGAVAQVLLSHVLTRYTDREQLDSVVDRMIGLL